MATIGNMGAEVGATSSIFPYTKSMGDYLRCTERGGIAQAAERALGYLRKDDGAEYDRHIDIVSLSADTFELIELKSQC
jgi:aconitase A